MKRLFAVKLSNGTLYKCVNGNHYFERKVDAKLIRDRCPGSHVTRGPDHWRYQA